MNVCFNPQISCSEYFKHYVNVSPSD